MLACGMVHQDYSVGKCQQIIVHDGDSMVGWIDRKPGRYHVDLICRDLTSQMRILWGLICMS
jgi:hypothetical protein